MDDLAAFLEARLDDDERIARACPPWPWRLEEDEPDPDYPPPHDGHRRGALFDADVLRPSVVFSDRYDEVGPQHDHAVRHDPARVLDEVDAKRRLIGDLLATEHLLANRDTYGCRAVSDREGDNTPSGKPCSCGRDEAVRRRLGLLALPYAGHPDYHEEWRSQHRGMQARATRSGE